MKSQTFSAEQIKNAAATALELELGRCGGKVPAGFRKATEWAKVWGRGLTSTRAIIAKHVEDGRMEAKQFSVKKNGGIFSPIPHYKAVK